MISGKSFHRLTAGAAVLAVSGAAAAVTTVAASAAPGDGTLTLVPETGTDQSVLTATTSAPCPADGNTDSYDVEVQGPGTFSGVLSGNASAGFSNTAPFNAQFAQSMAVFASSTNQTIVAGKYTIVLRCTDDLDMESRRFTGSITFSDPTHYTVDSSGPTPSPTPPGSTPTPSPTPPESTPTPSPTPSPTPPGSTPTPSPTPPGSPGAITTATRLSVIKVPLPFRLGGFVISLANVTPRNAVGTVQFKDGATNLGGPVPVAGGVAIGPFIILPAGAHSVTAVFTPTDPANFAPSTSNTVNFAFRRSLPLSNPH